MLKKITLLAMAVGALVAFAVPATASANVALTDGAGNETQVGTFVTALSHNTVTTTGAGTLSCSTVGITGELEENTPHVSIRVTNVTVSNPCSFAGVFAAHIKNPTANTITLETGGVGSASGATFESEITLPTGPRNCHFAAASLPITWSTSSINLNGTLTGTGTNCPTTANIHGDFGLWNDNHTVQYFLH